MDAAMPLAPGMAPPKKRRPFDPAALPLEMQQTLAGGQPVALEDGSVLYPDGTAEGAGDMPDDFDFGPGGFNASPQIGGPEALAAPGAAPLQGPLFRRFRQTANAPFPGQPGGIGGVPAVDPMGDAVGDTADAEPAPRMLTVEGPRVENVGGGPQAPGSRPSAPGRLGRRLSQSSRQSRMTSRRRR